MISWQGCNTLNTPYEKPIIVVDVDWTVCMFSLLYERQQNEGGMPYDCFRGGRAKISVLRHDVEETV